MDAKKLRIGNLVYELSGENKPIGVYKIKPSDIVFISNEKMKFPNTDYYKYIPLTEKRVVEFGFEKAADKYGGFLSPEFSGSRMRIKYNGFYFFYDSGFRKVRLDYVHQLQNLYFVFYEHEIELKETKPSKSSNGNK